MPWTMQHIITERLPDVLQVARSEFSDAGATGSLFDPDLVMKNIDDANRAIAHEANRMYYRKLKNNYDFSLTPEQLSQTEAEIDFPEYVSTPISLDAVSASGSDQRVASVWHHPEYEPYTSNQNVGRCQYHVDSTGLVIRRPSHQHYRMAYQKSPGNLIYGTLNTVTDESNFTVTVTAGEQSIRDDAYNNDWVAVTIAGTTHIRKVSDYNATTGVFTLASALPSLPTQGDAFSVLSFLQDDFQDLLVYGAAMRFDLPDKAAIARGKYDALMMDFRSAVRPLDSKPSKPLQTTDPFDFGEPGSGGRWPFGGVS